MSNGFTIHISKQFIDCFTFFGIGIVYGFLIPIAVDTFKNKRKAK